ncbi:unnamed protein product [Heterobilharzia americana]|nr:unnamed protein product [Heterobilharzia americana]
MAGQYAGFRVEITSSELGKIVGVVSSVSDKKISLTNAVINDYAPTIPSFSVESRFIQNIRILSTASGGESSGSDTPVKSANKSSNSSREQRREWLRNIPNTYSVYVCPDSPPIIHKTPGAPVSGSNAGNNDRSGHMNTTNLNDLQLLDGALAKVCIRESNDFSPARKYAGVNKRSHSKRRSYSMSETAATTSDVSGTESDSFHRHANSGTRGQFGGGSGGGNVNRHAQTRGHSRNHQNYNHRGGGNVGINGCVSGSNGNQKNSVDWDRIRVEEFIDEDFDFEGNLALFNKSAFYEMVDLREGHSIGPTPDMNHSSCISSAPPHFAEGPDGVGIPLLALSATKTTTTAVTSRSTSTIAANADHLEERNKSNTRTTSCYESQAQPKDSNHTNKVQAKDKNSLDDDSDHTAYVQSRTNPAKRVSYWWYTCIGQRVPICQLEQRQRLIHYLATGIDLDTQAKSTLISNSVNTAGFPGLTWGRLIESASRPLVDNIMMCLRQSNKTPQRVIHRPPARILIIPNGSSHLGATISLSVARQLSSLGSCVLLYASTLSKNNSPTGNDEGDDEFPVNSDLMSSVYRHELNLLKHLAPKPNQYGLDDEDESDNYDEEYQTDDEDNHGSDKQLPGSFIAANSSGSSVQHSLANNISNVHVDASGFSEQNDADFDSMSCCFSYSDSAHALQFSIVDYSCVGRMWMSRMPGLKIIRRPSSITKLPSGIRIDLVIIGHSDSNAEYEANSNLLINWLRNHNSIGGIIHLTPSQSIVDSNILLRNAQRFVWLIELGLPVLTPQCHSVSSQSSSSSSIPAEITPSTTTATLTTLTHLLIDIGLGRNTVRRLTGDLNLLPPYGLFDLGSMIQLCAEQSTTSQRTPTAAR